MKKKGFFLSGLELTAGPEDVQFTHSMPNNTVAKQ